MQRTRPARNRPARNRPERISAGDLMQLVSDVGSVPMNVGALLVLDTTPGVGLEALEAQVADRLGRIRRLRQRLVRLPWVLGRPVWVDEPDFDASRHVSHVGCPSPADRAALLDVAVDIVVTPLSPSGPLWRAVLVTGLADGRTGLLLVLHHVLADGVGGLAVVKALADPTVRPDPSSAPPTGPALAHQAPTRGQLFADALATRARAVRRTPQALGGLWRGRAELGLSRVELAPRCTLNVPTGPRRQVGTVTVELDGLRAIADAAGATVNDVLLTSSTGALQSVLSARGEHPGELVVSVPISARAATTASDLGNEVGVMPVRVPMVEPAGLRLTQVAARTRVQRTASRGSSSALVGPLFRLLAALGVLRWFVDRQRLVNSFLTNVRGPAERLTFAGAAVAEIVPVTVTEGNVTVAFAALSYAGSMTLVVNVDPDEVPGPAPLTSALWAELEALGIGPQQRAG